MQFSLRRDRAPWIIVVIALMCGMFGSDTLQAAAIPTSPPVIAAGTLVSAVANRDGSLQLATDAAAAAPVYGNYARFGQAIMPAIHAPAPFRALSIGYEATTPPGAALLVDLRTSLDGQRWSAWELDIDAGSVVTFAHPARYAQYRVTLLAHDATPTISRVVLAPARAAGLFRAMSDGVPIAPTFTIRGTRQGMVGGRTANGHRIIKRDHFVSLPCRCALSSKGGNEYQVRITYRGKTSVAPVYDVGPWNVRDNYWAPQEERYFSDLRQGWPQDHAAYYDGHNNGRAAKGRVRFPTAIDVGDGAWWDDLGIRGD
ncbi:MAG TPA: hypothetical protein PKC19_20095, partial [Roseiflexaceae bacterium]|nr:hypothetical protein [Roseiflexaceae bacterium]